MKLKIRNRIFAASVLASTVLAGCGGGSDSPVTPAAAVSVPVPVSTATAEGVYVGDLTGSRSNEFELLVLENGEFWTIYGTSSPTTVSVAGFIQGSGTSNNGKFTSSNAKDFGINPALAGTVSATYDATAKTIAGTVTATTGTVSFSGGPISGSLYNYNTPASLATIAGAWSTTTLTGEAVALNISSSGAFTATSGLGCNFSGTVTPRSSGKNVFNVGLTFGAAPCALPNQSESGIALSYPLGNGKTQLVVAATDGPRNNGAVVFGARTTPVVTPPTTTTPVVTPPTTTTTTSSKTCYTGPRGGTYTLTASGGKNYGGC